MQNREGREERSGRGQVESRFFLVSLVSLVPKFHLGTRFSPKLCFVPAPHPRSETSPTGHSQVELGNEIETRLNENLGTRFEKESAASVGSGGMAQVCTANPVAREAAAVDSIAGGVTTGGAAVAMKVKVFTSDASALASMAKAVVTEGTALVCAPARVTTAAAVVVSAVGGVAREGAAVVSGMKAQPTQMPADRKSTRLNSSHG